MRGLRPVIPTLLLTALAAPASRAGEKRLQPENWPTSPYPAGKPDPGGGEGCRMPMRELLQKYKKEELAVKTNIEDANAHWGSYTVGDDGGGCSAPGRDRAETPDGEGQLIPGSKGWVSVELDPRLVQRWIGDPESNRGSFSRTRRRPTVPNAGTGLSTSRMQACGPVWS